MQSKKQLLFRCTALIIGLALGITASFLTWHIKSYFNSPSSSVSRMNVEAFEKSDFWKKATLYFETSNKTFLDNYMNIYECYGLMDTMDAKLLEYFEKYGYDTVLVSGLGSDNKLANIYCIEKCCSLWGEDMYDKNEILNALKRISIDNTPITNEPNESVYINYAKDRLNLLISLTDGSYSSDKIIKNNLKTRMLWISNGMNGSEQIRIYDNGGLYTIDNITISSEAAMYFASDDTVVINDRSRYIIHLKNNITLYDIDKLIRDTLNEQDAYIEVLSLSVSGDTANAEFNKITDNHNSISIKKYTLSLDLTTQKATAELSE